MLSFETDIPQLKQLPVLIKFDKSLKTAFMKNNKELYLVKNIDHSNFMISWFCRVRVQNDSIETTFLYNLGDLDNEVFFSISKQTNDNASLKKRNNFLLIAINHKVN